MVRPLECACETILRFLRWWHVDFAAGHPVIPFLLPFASADDAQGSVSLAVFYPSGALSSFALIGLMAALHGLLLGAGAV